MTCAITVPAFSVPAFGDGLPPWAICAGGENAARAGARYLSLEPANGATVPAGTPVTFSGGSNYALTFSVASSEALVASPDIDSGMGSQSGAFYKFTSTKATAAPRTIYWTASFTFTPEDCTGPSTFTTPARTLTVLASPAEQETAAKNKSEEEAATKKKQEEEAPAGTAGVSKPKLKALTRAQRLTAALEACHKKGRRRRVMVCERQARKRFGQVKKTTNKK